MKDKVDVWFEQLEAAMYSLENQKACEGVVIRWVRTWLNKDRQQLEAMDD